MISMIAAIGNRCTTFSTCYLIISHLDLQKSNKLLVRRLSYSVKKMEIPAKHILHSKYSNSVLREWQCSNTEISAHNLMYPLFIAEADDAKECVESLPNVHRIGINVLRDYLEPTVRNGLKSVLLFGVLNKLPKDNRAFHADSDQNPVIKAIPLLKKWYPDLTIACDVCLCAYTSHGHCGILGEDKRIDNTASCLRLAEVACSYARAGADIVAPSDMMDGRIAAIKSKLRDCNFLSRVCVLSYSAKYQSCMYGPFRDVANSAPSFGDRRCYQLPTGSKGLALSAAKRDVEEGCDMLMVKPGIFYLDIVKQTKDNFPQYPLFVYQVSGEYAMLFHAAANNVFDLKVAVKESLTAFRRAGADCIITYFTPMVLKDLAKHSTY